MFDAQYSIFNLRSSVMELGVDVLAAVVVHRVLTQRDGKLVVDEELEHRLLSHTPWHAAAASATYSASQEEVATPPCFFEHHEIKLLLKKNT
jgi:hypothetical protein